MSMIFTGEIGYWPSNNWLYFMTYSDIESECTINFPLFQHWEIGHFLTRAMLLRKKCGQIFMKLLGG